MEDKKLEILSITEIREMGIEVLTSRELSFGTYYNKVADKRVFIAPKEWFDEDIDIVADYTIH